MSLRRMKTVSRRGDWRDTPLLYDPATFDRYPKAPGRFSLTLSREHDGAPQYARGYWSSGPDYGRRWDDCDRPVLALDSLDGVGFLAPGSDPRFLDCSIYVPQALMYRIPEGIYRASITFSGFDGTVIEVLSEKIAFVGCALLVPSQPHEPTADLQIPVDLIGAVNAALDLNSLGSIGPGLGIAPDAPSGTGGSGTQPGNSGSPTDPGGTGTQPGTPSPSNSSGGVLDFSDPANSGLLALFGA